MSKKKIPFSLTLPKNGRYITRDGRYPTSTHYFEDAISDEYPFVAVIEGKSYAFTILGKNVVMLDRYCDLFIEIDEDEPDICYVNLYDVGQKSPRLGAYAFYSQQAAQEFANTNFFFGCKHLGTYKINLNDKL